MRKAGTPRRGWPDVVAGELIDTGHLCQLRWRTLNAEAQTTLLAITLGMVGATIQYGTCFRGWQNHEICTINAALVT
ncbi:hypothetical protein [Escherichia coli]|uniref:hypothetical protein n=1 Tax=Escherichia coli TaxID=562 RepID=UPI00157AAC4E|nr:hypothetical protein [Escherichia coli]